MFLGNIIQPEAVNYKQFHTHGKKSYCTANQNQNYCSKIVELILFMMYEILQTQYYGTPR